MVGRGDRGGYYNIRSSGGKGKDEDPAATWKKQSETETRTDPPHSSQADKPRDAPK